MLVMLLVECFEAVNTRCLILGSMALPHRHAVTCLHPKIILSFAVL